MESHTCCVCRDERAPSIFDHQQQSSAGFFPWLPVLTIWTVDTQDNDARWKGASWVTRFLRELEEYCHGVQGLGGLGWRVWLKEYSLRILTLHTADPQGKQNIWCPDPRDWNAELVISCAISVLMERWHPSTYFEAPVIRCWIRQRLQRFGSGDSSPET